MYSTDQIRPSIPEVRPHVEQRGRRLFFLISKRHLLELSEAELLLFGAIDGHKTVADLEERHPNAVEILQRWYQAEVLEFITPVSPPSRPHLVIVEPHMDDAALSVGGRLLKRRGQCLITILSVVGRSNFTSYLTVGRELADVDTITRLRQQESDLAAKLFGAKHECLEWMDAPLRFWPAEEWRPEITERFKQAPQIFTNMVPDPQHLQQLAQQLLKRLITLAPDELWIPMGLGNHIDHRTTRGACLRALSEGRPRFSGVPVSLYEELPYAGTLGHAEQIRSVAERNQLRICRDTEDITDVFDQKIRAVSVYASQFKTSYIEPGLRRTARLEAASAGRFAEAYYRVEGAVTAPSEVNLSREKAGLEKLQARISSLTKRRLTVRRLTIIALPSGSLGKWDRDSAALLGTFSSSVLRVYAAKDLAWQVDPLSHESKIEFIKTKREWFRVLRKEVFRFGTPTILLWRGAYGAAPLATVKKLVNTALVLLLPFRRILFARTLWDVRCMLNKRLESEMDQEGNTKICALASRSGY